VRTTLAEGEFALVAGALRSWPDLPAVPADCSTPVVRLLDAARTAAERPYDVGAPDLAVLLRHVLRADAELTGASNGLKVPEVEPWPRDDEWAHYGLRATADRVVFAEPWLPGWLGAEHDPAAAAFRGGYVPPLGDAAELPADPFLVRAAHVANYRSAGQREAIRAVLATPPAATVIGNLPTGTGKSLVAYLPALMSKGPGTTIVVVPTTSLAIDQERAFLERVQERPDRERFPRELAYHAQLAESSRAAIKERIAQGTQRIVFTSPESATQSLQSATYAAAERGYLASLVIDEAHIVSQWGAEFRTAFQSLAGVRAELLRVATEAQAPFRTILLSATLTEESLFTLQNLFGRPGPTEFISAVALRHEPSYWLARADDEESRVARVADALRHLPRPLVLYTTRVPDALAWHDRLREQGFRRLMVVAGPTDAEGRKTAIRRLRAGSLDLVVGTSAFGLGVDQPDLRAVVHACIPETIDRYYQEVGRGGRDGKPSVSVLVSTAQDRVVADRLSQRKLISLERGFERWSGMHALKESLGEGRLRVPLWIPPADLPKGDTPETRAWNMRTLLLMDRGGLISLEASPPPRRAEGESDEAWAARAPDAFEEYAAHAELTVKEGNFADPAVWEEAVGDARGAAIEADRTARQRMDEALKPAAKLCTLFASTYRLERPLPGIAVGQIPVPVMPSCGGCPGCRAEGLPPRRFVAPTPRPAVSLDRTWATAIRQWFGGQQVLAVLYEPDDEWADTVTQVCERLARLGLWCIAGPAQVVKLPRIDALFQLAPHRAVFVLGSWERLRAPNLPTVLIYAPDATVPEQVLRDGGPERIVIASRSAADPRHATQTVGEYHSTVTTAQDIVERM
jgi:ATP-dependent DNA helicase RecQ